MTIPPFEENGYLPPGVHWTTWEEFKEQFGTTSKRELMLDGLVEAMKHLKAAGCRAIYINGSFVTAKVEPNDFDACWDLEEDIDLNYLRINAPVLLKFFDRAALKSKYKDAVCNFLRKHNGFSP